MTDVDAIRVDTMTGEGTRIDAIAADAMTRDPVPFAASASASSRFSR